MGTLSQRLPGEERAEYLPDFCAPGVVLAVVLISELVAIVLTLGQIGLGSFDDVWVCRRIDIARHWRKHFPVDGA